MSLGGFDETLGASPRFLRALGIAVVACDARGRVVSASDAAGDLLRRSALDLEGRSIETILPGFGQARATTSRARVVGSTENGKSADFRLRALCPDGAEIPVRIVVGSVITRIGKIALCHLTDVSSEHETEADALERARTANRRAADCAVLLNRTQRLTGAGHLVSDDGDTVVVSQSLQGLLGLADRSLPTETLLDWIVPPERERVREAFAQSSEKLGEMVDFRLVAEGGGERRLRGIFGTLTGRGCFGVIREASGP